ncbi:MAG: anthrone oxygenase family protein [Bacteroidota bacterium]
MENPLNLNVLQIVQVIAILLTGLVAGLFYGYDCSVVKGLGNLPDDLYLRSFQSINRSIQNPYFFFSFMGSLVTLPTAAWLNYKNCHLATFYLLLSATVVYFIGVFGVTLFCNVPLNERLANFSISTATTTDLSAMRQTFEKPWNNYHTVRTIASVISFGLTILSLIRQKI